MTIELLTQLLNLPAVEVLSVSEEQKGAWVLQVRSTQGAALCPDCARPTMNWCGREEVRQVRDLSLSGRPCYLRFEPRRFRCVPCGRSFVERLSWLAPEQRQTERYQEHVFRLARQQDEHSVGQLEGLSDDEVRHIFRRWAKKD